MKTRGGSVIALLVGVVALVLGTSACGGGGNENPSDGYIGVWELESMEGPDAYSSEELAELGGTITLILTSDGDAMMDIVDDIGFGTWSAKSKGSASITIEGDTIPAAIDGEKLRVSIDETDLIFLKTDRPAVLPTSDPEEEETYEDEPLDEETDEPVASGGDTPEYVYDDVVDAEFGMPFGTPFITITIDDAKTDEVGDPGYTLHVENFYNMPVNVSYQMETFSVDGVAIDPGLFETVPAGESVDVFLWFDSAEVPDAASLRHVQGILEVTADDGEIVAKFLVYFPDGY